MPRGRPKQELVLSPSEREQLVSMTRSRSMPHVLVRRERIVLMAADGCINTVIAEALDVSRTKSPVEQPAFMGESRRERKHR
jgi:FixJ family two-component response regulator